jgi:hypothetical protein
MHSLIPRNGSVNRRATRKAPTVLLDPTTKEREIVDVGADTSFIESGFGSVWLPPAGKSRNSGEDVRLTLQ